MRDEAFPANRLVASAARLRALPDTRRGIVPGNRPPAGNGEIEGTSTALRSDSRICIFGPAGHRVVRCNVSAPTA